MRSAGRSGSGRGIQFGADVGAEDVVERTWDRGLDVGVSDSRDAVPKLGGDGASIGGADVVAVPPDVDEPTPDEGATDGESDVAAGVLGGNADEEVTSIVGALDDDTEDVTLLDDNEDASNVRGVSGCSD